MIYAVGHELEPRDDGVVILVLVVRGFSRLAEITTLPNLAHCAAEYSHQQL